MTLDEQLSSLVLKATREVISPAVAASKQMATTGVCGRIIDGQVQIVSKRKLVGPAFRDASGALDSTAVFAYVDNALSRPDVDFVLVANEAWMNLLAIPPEDGADRFSHLQYGLDGRAEVVICAIYCQDFQTAVIHGIRRAGKARLLSPGPNEFDGVGMGGRFARAEPTRH